MAITDEHVAALRAFLVSDSDQAGRLTKQLVETGQVEGYGELIYAAFCAAVRRRFSPSWTLPEVIRFVASVRACLRQNGVDVEPHTTEILIRRALGDNVAAKLGEEAKARAQVLVLPQLIRGEGLDGAELDALLAEARTLADQLLN